MEARHQPEDPCAAGSTRERGFREGAMVLGDTCLFVKNWTFLLGYQWRRNERPTTLRQQLNIIEERTCLLTRLLYLFFIISNKISTKSNGISFYLL